MKNYLLTGILFFTSFTATAARLDAVVIDGVDDSLKDNIKLYLSLSRVAASKKPELSEARLAYLVELAPKQVASALEPFGFYQSSVKVQSEQSDKGLTLRLQVDTGPAVRVSQRQIDVLGDAQLDERIIETIAAFEPALEQVFVHPVYEENKHRVSQALLERGYFDAQITQHQVRVDPQALTAEIELLWQGGERYQFGQSQFSPTPIDDELLRVLQPWNVADAYDQALLLKYQKELVELDYFASVTVQPKLADKADQQMPIEVALSAAKRSRYQAGVSFGTDSGLGFSAGLERRWLNDRGHKFSTAADIAQRKQSLSTQYRIPAFHRLRGWYVFDTQITHESDGDALEFVKSLLSVKRTAKLNEHWSGALSMNLQHEAFGQPGDLNQSTALAYPELSLVWKKSNGELANSWQVALDLRAGSGQIDSGTYNFAQALIKPQIRVPLNERNSLKFSAQFGVTEASDFYSLPASLRFYAGGDRSIRGYGYREVGPVDGAGVFIGAPYLLTTSVEWEHQVTSQWGTAVFVDSGDAFVDRDAFDPKSSVGIGLRWKSPIGPIGIDLAHGLDAQDKSIRLHLNFGGLR